MFFPLDLCIKTNYTQVPGNTLICLRTLNLKFFNVFILNYYKTTRREREYIISFPLVFINKYFPGAHLGFILKSGYEKTSIYIWNVFMTQVTILFIQHIIHRGSYSLDYSYGLDLMISRFFSPQLVEIILKGISSKKISLPFLFKISV